jgi:hypothetical protein
MTSGGLMQLVAYGAQDVYLTANPQITFFKQLYRRHSNFAMESIEQVFNGQGGFGKRVQCTLSRNGDLITKVYVQVTLPAIDDTVVVGDSAMQWVPYLGQFLIDSVLVEIGGQQIDKHYGQWLNIWNELTIPVGKSVAYTTMVNGYGNCWVNPSTTCSPCNTEGRGWMNNSIEENNYYLAQWNGSPYGARNNEGYISQCVPETTLYVPLEFWFNRHTGLALPLIALQYHEVKINVDFQQLQYLVNITGSDINRRATFQNLSNLGLVACSLYVDYIYLDTEERRRFAQVAHEYLIEQLQFTGTESVTSTSSNIKLSLNHPVKELIWVVQNPSYIDCNYLNNWPYDYTTVRRAPPVAVAKLQLNGQDRFTEREGSYFNYVQPYQHHTNTPSKGIYVYSFALRPEDLQPSGSCNFSRIDNAVLNLTLNPGTFGASADNSSGYDGPILNNSTNVNIYATNYNVLRIMSGMGGLAYSN